MGAAPTLASNEDPIGTSTFTVPVLNKTTNQIENVTYNDPTSLSPGKYLLGIMLSRVINMLILMIQTMQGIAVQQSNKLTFFTQMQSANTAQMNSIHTFALDNQDPTFISGNSDSANTDRQSLNQSNATYLQEIQANNNLIANTAKQMQTNINNTQDAINQQSNMLSSLMQEIQTINSSIYR